MKGSNANVLTIAKKCKNILASNWQGNLNTIKADSKGSKQNIYTSKVKYLVKRGKPYIWVPENDLHNGNTVVDERASFAVASPHPGRLGNLLRSMKKLPARIALGGEVVPVGEEKVKSAYESLREMIIAEKTEIEDSGYAVSAPLATKLIDGINQSELRRRALVVLCFAFLNVYGRDAYVKSVDCKGFDVLVKVAGDSDTYVWKEYRLTLSKEAQDIKSFCSQLVQMEEVALEKVKSLSGLA
ncbi:hypothetical protein KSS87_014905 [Heliosperma pusillum]|nr:hypothetical protein KSS87_014905 [Heliosperma pusillum]